MLREMLVTFLLMNILTMAIPLCSNYCQTEKAFTAHNFIINQSFISEYK